MPVVLTFPLILHAQPSNISTSGAKFIGYQFSVAQSIEISNLVYFTEADYHGCKLPTMNSFAATISRLQREQFLLSLRVESPCLAVGQ